MDKKSTGQLEDLIGPAQLLDLALQLLDTLRFCGSDTVTQARIDLYALDLFIERLRHTADFWGDGFDGRPKRWVLASVLLHHAYCAFANLG